MSSCRVKTEWAANWKLLAQRCFPDVRLRIYWSYPTYHNFIDFNCGRNRRWRSRHSFLHDFFRFLNQASSCPFKFLNPFLQHCPVPFLQKPPAPRKRRSVDRLWPRKHHASYHHDGQYGRHPGLYHSAKLSPAILAHYSYDFTLSPRRTKGCWNL